MIHPFKIVYLNEDTINKSKIEKVILFTTEIDESTLLSHIKNNNKEQLNHYFTNEEIDYITKQTIEIRVKDIDIYLDDTIEDLKKKIILYDSSIIYEDIYLFFKKKVEFNIVDFYNELTQYEKLDITNHRLLQSLINYDNLDLSNLEKKDVYEFEDLLNIEFDKDKVLKKHMLGQHIILNKLEYNYTVNPYECIIFDDLLVDNTVETTNNHLLLDQEHIHNHTIYMVLGDKLLKNREQKEVLRDLYFPFYKKKQLLSEDQIVLYKQENKTEISELFQSNIEKTKNIYKLGKVSNINKEGVKMINIKLIEKTNYLLPLEIIFKRFNSDKQIPFIKYVNDYKREDLFRLYSEQVSVNKEKIPLLEKALIFRLKKEFTKTNTIGLYLNNNITCEIDNHANITIKVQFSELTSLEDVELVIKQHVNILIKKLNKILTESGYKIRLFNSLRDDNIEILDCDYRYLTNVEYEVRINKYIACISNLFSLFENKGVSHLRYKKVQNFNNVSAKEAHMIELMSKEIQRYEILVSVSNNFNISLKEAETDYLDLIASLELEDNYKKNASLKLSVNPGIHVQMSKLSGEDNNLLVSIKNFSNLHYIHILKQLLTGIINITQKKYDESFKSFLKTCTNKQVSDETDKVIEEDIKIEKPEEKLEDKDILLEPEQEDEVTDEFTSMFFDTEDEDDEDDEEDDEDDEDDEDEDEDDDDEDDDEDDMMGGAEGEEEDEKFKEDLSNIKLKNPNYFEHRLQKREPKLFLKKVSQGYKSYSRLCPSNVKRQPVILTEKEKAKIDKEHPGSYTHSIKYGTDKNKPYYYICPRYWCMKDNTSLTREEVEQGACGGLDAVADENATELKDKTIVEFFNKKEHTDGKTSKYYEHHPGFLDRKSHPDNFCIPCCFKKWDQKKQHQKRSDCANDLIEKTDKKVEKESQIETYILGVDKFPLEKNRWGELPLSAQLFLKVDNKQCMVKKNTIKDNKACLFRYGVEKNNKQSFIACIADIYHKLHNIDKNNITIKEMKQHIINALTIDNYVTYQNGNLVETFYVEKEINLDEYKDSALYKKLIKNERLLKKIICSFENFKDYLNNDDIVINHEYLWDIVSSKNEKLIKSGLNLVILEVTDYDGTDDINLICPTNSYSSLFYSSEKNYLFLLKFNEYYEPIYSYKITEENYEIKKLFKESEKDVKHLNTVISNIKNLVNKECIPEKDKNKLYHFKQNIYLKQLLFELKKIDNLTIISLAINNNGKAIGVRVQYKQYTGFIPCYPSNILNDYNLENIYDVEGLNYTDTIDFLHLISKKSNDKIVCNPKVKILENGLVVGILTETNNFIRLKEPEEKIEDELETVTEADYYRIDYLQQYKKKMNKDLFFIKKIELEDKFYTLFRNILRIEINKFENRYLKTKIIRFIHSIDYSYSEKIKLISHELTQLLHDKVEFFEYNNRTLRELDDIGFCDNKEIYCLQIGDKDEYKLLIPLTNLVNEKNNKEYYFLKLSDELVRYKKNRVFIFNLHVYTLLQNNHYNLHDNEILLLSSVLTQDYFSNFIPEIKNKYVHSDTFDKTNPEAYKKEKKVKDLDEDAMKIEELECNTSIKPTITGKLSKVFKQYTLKQYDKTIECTFRLILDLEKKYHSIDELKKIIIDYLSEFDLIKVLKVLNDDKKDTKIKQIKKKQITLKDYILSSNYYLTNIDIWILANKLRLPIVLLSGTKLKETDTPLLVLYDSDDVQHYHFIRTSARSSNIPQYSAILNKDKELHHDKQTLPLPISAYIKDNNKDIKLHDYLTK